MLPEVGVQWLCASSYNRAGMQHDDGGNPEKKDPFLQLMEMGMTERKKTPVMHKGSFQHWELTVRLLCNRLEEIMCQIEVEKDEKAVH